VTCAAPCKASGWGGAGEQACCGGAGEQATRGAASRLDAAAPSWRSLHGRTGRRPSSRRKPALVAAERGVPAQGPRGVGPLALLTAGNDGKAALQGGGGVVEAAEHAYSGSRLRDDGEGRVVRARGAARAEVAPL